MSRLISGPVLIAAALSIAAIVVSIRFEKFTNVLIGAAVTASTAVAMSVVLERRVFDAYEQGRRAERRALARKLDDLNHRRG